MRLFVCIFLMSLALYFTIDKQNGLTELRLAIPAVEKQVRQLQKENIQLQYEVERFENPLYLLELLRKPEFSHLHFPLENEVVVVASMPPFDSGEEE